MEFDRTVLSERQGRMDIKKALFKFGDKLVFAAFLLLFLFSTYKFFGKPAQGPENSNTYVPVKEEARGPGIVIRQASNKLRQRIDRPPIPKDFVKDDFATNPEGYLPIPGKEKLCSGCGGWIMPIEVMKCPKCGYSSLPSDDFDGDGIPDKWEKKYKSVMNWKKRDSWKDPDKDGFTNLEEYRADTDPSDPASRPSELAIVELNQQPVDILFMGYFIEPGGDPDKPDSRWTIQFNWSTKAGTVFRPFKGYFRGYRLDGLEMKTRLVWYPRLNEWMEKEDWYLTLRKKTGRPIVVKRGEQAREQEVYAKVRVTRGKNKGRTSEKLYEGDLFFKYKVTSVTLERVKLKDKHGVEVTLRPRSSR